MSQATLFIPHALAQAPIIRESRAITKVAPPRDWREFDAPACERVGMIKKRRADLDRGIRK